LTLAGVGATHASAAPREDGSSEWIATHPGCERHGHGVWPEADPHQAESDLTLIATTQACVYHAKDADTPCSSSDLDDTRAMLALGPERLLLTAAAAPDLHYASGAQGRPHALRSGTDA
jgi:hypothetical protein